ncbi:MAG TPA: helix-turn-helix transcriptional regulator [Ktedonobacteraceae bacterium]|nr:helix-turn-helix transcriptional regulator [Ktedonobacteraceae bacterium]
MRNTRLRLARLRKNLSEVEVCRALGADLRTYQHWESGKHLPQPFYRKKLCAYFGVSLEELGFDLATWLPPQGSGRSLSAVSPSVPIETSEADVLPLPTDLLELAMLALRIGQREQGWSDLQVQEYVMSQMSQSDQPGTVTRREFGLLLAGLPLAALALTDIPEELFPHCEANLTTAWKLSRGKDLPLAQSIVQAYLPALRPLAERLSPYQKKAAELVAKSFMLNGLIEMHMVHLEAREQSCRQAVKYAEISENIDLIVAAYRWLGTTYYYHTFNDPVQALKAYQPAEGYLNRVRPILRSSFLINRAIGLARLQQRQEALTSLEQSRELFFGEVSIDQNDLYTGADIGTEVLNSGKVYYALGDYQKSLDTLLRIDGFRPKLPTSERHRLELLIHQTLAAAKLNDLEQATTYLEAAATGAVELDSRLRFSEARNAYQVLQFLWPNEMKVAELRPLFQKNLT